MDYKKLIPLVVGVLLAVGGAVLGINLKGEVCGTAPAAAVVK